MLFDVFKYYVCLLEMVVCLFIFRFLLQLFLVPFFLLFWFGFVWAFPTIQDIKSNSFFWSNFAIRLKSFFLSRRYMYGIYEYKCIHLLKMWSMCRKSECNLSKYQNENLCTSMHIPLINSSNDDSMYMRSFSLVRSQSSCSLSLCHSQSMCLRWVCLQSM